MSRRPTTAELAVEIGHLQNAHKDSNGMLREVLGKLEHVHREMATREQVAALEAEVRAHAPEVAKVAKLEQQVADLRKEVDSRVRPLEDERTRARAVLAFASMAAGTGGLGIGAALMKFFGGH